MSASAPLLRVLDVTDGLGAAAVRLFVGMGADVLRVQRDDQPEPGANDALHWYAGTRLIRAPAAEFDDVIRRHLPGCDVVIESGPVADLTTVRLHEADPDAWSHIGHVVITPFGLSGPRSGWSADDHVLAAAGGMTWLGGRPGEAPQAPPHQQAMQLAGTHGAIAALLTLLARRRTGQGQWAEVAAQEAVAATLETGAIAWIHAATVPGRTGGVYGHVAHRVFPSADGHVAGGYSGPDRMWRDLLAWMDETGEAGDLTEGVWSDPVHRWTQRPHVDEVVTAWARRRSSAELGESARLRSLPWAEVTTAGGLESNPQLQARQFFLRICTDDAAVTDCGFPYESPGRPRPVTLTPSARMPASVGWHTAAGVATLPMWQQRGGHGALAGLRVLDLTWVLAGPYVTKTLAEHGADVIKVESMHRQDPTRFAPSMRLRPGASPDESGYFVNFNHGKRSIALNLRAPGGPDLLRRLAGEVDVVIENFSPGTLAGWGLGPHELRELNPRCVLVSMAGVGATGPWRQAVTFADTLAAWSGLTHATAGVDGVPVGLTFGLGDMVAANAATVALLESLLRAEGTHLDLSQLEAMAAHLGTAKLDAQHAPGAGAAAGRVGPWVLQAPGVDRWLAVGAAPAQAWRTLTSTDDPGPWLAAFAAATDPDLAAAELQLLGIPAYPVRDGRDLVDLDPQLAAREFYPTRPHPLIGPVRVEGPLHHLADAQPGTIRSAPLLGEHTDDVLTELLALSSTEIARLREEGVLQ